MERSLKLKGTDALRIISPALDAADHYSLAILAAKTACAYELKLNPLRAVLLSSCTTREDLPIDLPRQEADFPAPVYRDVGHQSSLRFDLYSPDIWLILYPLLRRSITMLDQSTGNAAGSSSISVVIPLLNEEPVLERLHCRLAAVLREMDTTYEIIFVDDGSTDGSIKTIQRLRVIDPSVRYVRFRRNFGKSAALAAGFRYARFETIVTMDADLQDLPEQLPVLMSKLGEGFDLVSGWRHQRHDKLTRRLGSRLYNWTTAKLTGVRLHDINCGFKCYRREVLDEVMIYGERHRYIPVLASYRGFRLGEVKIQHAPRDHGRSRYGFNRVIGGIFSLLTVILLTRYSNRPLHFFGLMGAALFGVGTAIDLYLIMARVLFKEWLSNRPLLIIGTLFVIVGVQFVLFGLLAEMIAFSYRRESDYSIVEMNGAGDLALSRGESER